MGKISRPLALVLFSVFIVSCVALPQNSKALAPNITLSSIGVTQTTVTLSWVCTEARWVETYTLYMSTASNYAEGNGFTAIWTSGKNQTTTVVSNLTPNSTYYFFIQDITPAGIENSGALEAKTASNPTLWLANKTANTATLQWSDDNNYTSWAPFDGYIIEETTNASSSHWTTIVDLTNQTVRTYDVQSTNGAYVRLCEVVGNSTVGNINLSFSNIAMIGNETVNPTLIVPEFPTSIILPLFAIAPLLLLALIRKIPTSSKKKTKLATMVKKKVKFLPLLC